MFTPEILSKRANKNELNQEEIKFIIDGIGNGSVDDAQAGAFCAYTLLNPLTVNERIALTVATAESGDMLGLNQYFDKPVLGKHSSGGVGDKISLIVAPIIAACGGVMPKLSGRGLGHTGGTLDKLESIPGYQIGVSQERLIEVARQTGCAIVGATGDIAPADKKMYAIRDVTGSVPSIDLITASILGKKLAEGSDALVLDVKWGSGAFMQTEQDALALAESMHSVANGYGLPCSVVVSDMNQILGSTAGNAVEARESIDFLTSNGPRDERLKDVVNSLCQELLIIGGIANNIDQAQMRIENALNSGSAAQRFGQMVHALGGPADLIENPDKYLRSAAVTQPIFATEAGYLSTIDTTEIGMIIGSVLGGGRMKAEDTIDHSTGITEIKPLGTKVEIGTPIAQVHARSLDEANEVQKRINAAITLSNTAPKPTHTIHEIIEAGQHTQDTSPAIEAPEIDPEEYNR